MLRPWLKPVAVTLLGSVSMWAVPQQAAKTQPANDGKVQAKKKSAARKQVKKAPEPIPIPIQPPPPQTPEQMPATPPQVNMTNGLLSITATNSTMGDVLTAVRRQTGAAVELPPGGGSDRIAVRLGPGQPKDVIASLLNGSRFDYIILGSMSKPGGVDRIILTSRQNLPGGQQTNAMNRPGQPVPGQAQAPAPANEGDGEAEEDNAPERDAADAAGETEQEQPQPDQPYQPVPTPQGQQPDQQQQQQPGQPQVKTPEELLRELQQMRQQQQNPQQQNPQQQQPQDTPNEPPR